MDEITENIKNKNYFYKNPIFCPLKNLIYRGTFYFAIIATVIIGKNRNITDNLWQDKSERTRKK